MATYTFSGPSTGVQQAASTNFTITMDATVISGPPVIVTPNDGGAGGTFTPASLSFTTASQALTLTYTPLTSGAATLSTTNNKAYINPASLTYTVTLSKDLAINQLLWILAQDHGFRFPFYEITRDGGISVADAIALRTSFDAYYKVRSARPTLIPAHEDLAAMIHTTNLQGDVGRGQTPAGEDTKFTYDVQTGDAARGTNADVPETDRGIDSTGK